MFSPILFAVYVNDIICTLSASGCGYAVASIYIAVLGLLDADALLLISSTLCCELRRVTTIFEDDMKWLDMCFKCTKHTCEVLSTIKTLYGF